MHLPLAHVLWLHRITLFCCGRLQCPRRAAALLAAPFERNFATCAARTLARHFQTSCVAWRQLASHLKLISVLFVIATRVRYFCCVLVPCYTARREHVVVVGSGFFEYQSLVTVRK